MPLLRIALGLARSSEREPRWRLVVVPVVAFVALMIVCGGVSLVAMHQQQDQRHLDRSFELATTPRSSDVFIKQELEIWRGHRIFVAWVEPASALGRPNLPAGMTRFPEPGESVVSPELARLATEHESVARMFPQRSVLTDEGIRSGGELIAYRRPPAGRLIGGEETAVRLADGRVIGEGPLARAGAFGGEEGVPIFPADALPLPQLAAGVIAGTAIPSVLLLLMGLTAASKARDRRLALLDALGATAYTRARLCVAEALILTVPSFVLAVACWYVIGQRLTAIPVVGLRVVGGDLALSLTAVSTILTGAVLATATLAAATAGRGLKDRGKVGFEAAGTRGNLGFIPLALALLAFIAADFVPATVSGDVLLLGMLLALGGAPFVLGAIFRRCGGVLGGSRSPAISLTGRSMAWQPVRLARPFYGMAALVVLAWGVAGIYSVGDIPEPTNHSLGRGPSAAIVSWHDPRAEDIESLRAGLPSDVVVPLARISATSSVHDKTPVEPSNEQGHHHSAADKQKHAHDDRPAVDQSPPAAHDHSVPVRLAMGTTCAELATALGPETCSGASTLTVQGRARLVETLAKSVHEPITGIRIVRAGLPTFDSVAVLGAQSLPQLDERVRAVSMSALPAPHVDSAVFRLSRPAQTLNGWILGVAAISLGALALASLVAMVDRSLQQREQHRLLLNLGASPHALKSLGAALFGVSYVVACTVGMGIGVFVCAQMVDDGVPLPWTLINAVAAVLIILGLLGTGAMALFNARAVYRTIE